MKKDNLEERISDANIIQSVMPADDFWTIVDHCKDHDEPELVMEKTLKMGEPWEIESFKWHHQNFVSAAFRPDIKRAAKMLHDAAYGIDGDCPFYDDDSGSDDAFHEFLYGLIVKGKKVYEDAFDNPDSLVAFFGEDISRAGYCGTPRRVYAELTGDELPMSCWDVPGTLSGEWEYEYLSPDEWHFLDETENRKHLPKLSTLYYAERAQKTS